MPNVPTDEEVMGYFERLSNWGRWGPDDELGTLNLITPDKRLQAVQSVRDGISVGCARTIVAEGASDTPRAPLHFMITSGESQGAHSATDFLGIAPHGLSVSHIDTLGHIFWQGKFYNDRPRSLITTAQGSTVCSIETMKDGVVTRGVLLDIARLKGKRWLEAGEGVFPEDLEAAEAAQGVRLEAGDALCVRTGWSLKRLEQGPPPSRERPGLNAACLPWLHERGVAVLAADASQDVIPSGYQALDIPIHVIGVAAMGLCLLDACQFDDLARACAERDTWTFLFAVAPLRFRHATGSPVTPLAIL